MEIKIYQTRKGEDQPWMPLNGDNAVRIQMQISGFRYSELTGHIEDLNDGHLLTAEDGREFRLLPKVGA